MKNSKQRGFTLIELMIVIAIMAIIVSFATPAYDRFIRNSSVQREARGFESALQMAKFNARNSGRKITVCGTDEINDNEPKCLDKAGLSAFNQAGGNNLGWVVFRDTDGDGEVDSGETVFKKVPFSPNRVRMIWNGNAEIKVSSRNETGDTGTMCIYSPVSAELTTCSSSDTMRTDKYEARVVLSGLGNVTYKR